MVEAPSGILLVEEASDDLGRWPNSHDLLPINWSLGKHDQLVDRGSRKMHESI